MLHKLSAGSATSPHSSNFRSEHSLHIARTGSAPSNAVRPGFNSDLVPILSRRCSSFFAEAAVLVLVFGLLDYFMMKGRIELPWIAGALLISLLLLTLSIAIEFTAQRWIKAHP